MTLYVSNLYTRTLSSMNSVALSSSNVTKVWNDKEVSTFKRVQKITPELALLAFRVAKAFCSVIFETVSLPVRYPYVLYKFHKQLDDDIAQIPANKLSGLKNRIEGVIESENLKLNGLEKERYVRAALSTYVSSQKYYAPVVKEWALSLLSTAAQENHHLVFLARDGVAPYQAALELQKKDPQFKDVKIHLKYLSRKVVRHATSTEPMDKSLDERRRDLNTYFFRNGEIKPDDKCLFVDVGFMGSMIWDIRKEISSLKPPAATASDVEKKAYKSALVAHYQKIIGPLPEIDKYIQHHKDLSDTDRLNLTPKKKEEFYLHNLYLDVLKAQYPFNFLVSHSEKASGYMGNVEVKLSSVESAGSNRAVHWLEDTHQEVINSPQYLVRKDDQDVVPNVLLNPQKPATRKEEAPGEFLIKRMATCAIQDYIHGHSLFDAYEEVQKKERVAFLAELEKENIRANSITELCANISAYIHKKNGIKSLNINFLKACSFVLLRQTQDFLRKGHTLHRDELLTIQNLVGKLTNEINDREKAHYMPGAMATEQTRAVFDKFLLELYEGRRFLYIQHR